MSSNNGDGIFLRFSLMGEIKDVVILLIAFCLNVEKQKSILADLRIPNNADGT